MTIEQCHQNLATIRRKQGTNSPLIRVDFGGTAYKGRLARTDSDLDHRLDKGSPFGIIVLEAPGLAPGIETVLQIASIPEGGICGVA